MNSQAPHPDSETLLRLADQDLSVEEATRVDEHLAACDDCRERLDAVREALSDYDRFHREILKPSLPAPPRPWKPLPFPQPTRSYFRPAPWLAAAAAILLAVFLVRRFEQTPSVRAAELLRQAVAADQAKPGASDRRIRIRSRSLQLDRPAHAPTNAPGAGAAALESAFVEVGYSWENPLSADAFARWRSGLPREQDRIEETSGVWVLRTSPAAGPLSEAALTLRMADFHAIACTLRLRSSGEVIDITELPPVSQQASATPAKPQSPTAPAIPSPAPPAAFATPGDELRVIAALHSINADLGEPVEVERSDAAIVVQISGVDQKLRDRIRTTLAGLPAVQLRFVDIPASDPGAHATSSPRATAVDRTNPLIADLATRAGATSPIAELTDNFIDATDRASARAFALRDLARRFPPSVESALSPSQMGQLHGILRDHTDGLVTAIQEIHLLLSPVLPERSPPPDSAANWEAIAADLPAQIGQLDRTLNGAADAGAARKAQLSAMLAGLAREAGAIKEMAR